MPRLQGGGIKTGGQTDPGTSQAITTEKQQKENRLIAAMQAQSGVQQAQIRAGSAKQTTEATIGAQQEMQAMDVEQADKRAAEKIAGAREDKTYSEKMMRLQGEITTERDDRAREFETEIRIAKEEKFDQLMNQQRTSREVENWMNRVDSQRTMKMIYSLMKQRMAGEAGQEKSLTIAIDMAEKAGKNQKIAQQQQADAEEKGARLIQMSDIFEPAEGQPAATEDQAINIANNLFKNSNVDITANMLTGDNLPQLEELVGTGKLKYDQIASMNGSLTALIKSYNDAISDLQDSGIKKRPTTKTKTTRVAVPVNYPVTVWTQKKEEIPTKEWDRYNLLRRQQGKAVAMQNVLTRLGNSKQSLADGSGQTVGQTVKAGLNFGSDHSPGMILNKAFTEYGEQTPEAVEKMLGSIEKLMEQAMYSNGAEGMVSQEAYEELLRLDGKWGIK